MLIIAMIKKHAFIVSAGVKYLFFANPHSWFLSHGLCGLQASKWKEKGFCGIGSIKK